MDLIFARQTVGIAELKANPSAVLEAADGEPVALLNRNKPVAYIVPAARWEKLLEMLDDLQLAEIVKERMSDGEPSVEVDISRDL